jgi:phosphatidylserine decarboxylase
MRIAREGYREILIATIIFLGAAIAGAWAALSISPWFWLITSVLALWFFVIAFFRDPERKIPMDKNILVSPADGKITEVAELDEYQGMSGPVRKISVFLSVFDVHINRIPCDGRVVDVLYRPGEFLDARHPQCGIRNESNTIVIEPSGGLKGPILVRQVAGLIARRIICNVRRGDVVTRGQRLGLIKFGSRTDLIVPADSGLQSAVAVNDFVKGGESILMAPASGGVQQKTSNQRPAGVI